MDIKKPQLVKVGAFAVFWGGVVLQHPHQRQKAQNAPQKQHRASGTLSLAPSFSSDYTKRANPQKASLSPRAEAPGTLRQREH